MIAIKRNLYITSPLHFVYSAFKHVFLFSFILSKLRDINNFNQESQSSNNFKFHIIMN